jgi:hypothetical protein
MARHGQARLTPAPPFCETGIPIEERMQVTVDTYAGLLLSS